MVTATKTECPVQSRDDLSSGGFTYPARLVEGGKEIHEGSGDWRLRLVFDRLDRMWDDGNPVKAFITLFLTYKGEPTWAGSDADVVAKSFEDACGADIFNDEALAGLIGSAFQLTDEEQTGKDGQPKTYTDNKGRERKSYLTTCQEFLGDTDYAYTGHVSTVVGQNGSKAPVEVADPAVTLAELLSGNSIEDLKMGLALDIVKGNTTLPATVLGKPLRGGLVKPRSVLIDLLIENGFATDEDGVFMVVEA